MSTIICRYCNKLEHIEGECRKKQYNQKGKGRRFFPQVNNASLQCNTKEYEDEDNNFIQAFLCEMELTQTKDESRSNKIEACYLQNRSPHKALSLNTPYAMWFGYKPNLLHLRVFGARHTIILPKRKGENWIHMQKKEFLLVMDQWLESKLSNYLISR